MGGLHLCGVVAGTMVTRDCHMFNTQNTKYRWCMKESQQLRQSVSHSNTHYWIIAECSHLASTLIPVLTWWLNIDMVSSGLISSYLWLAIN